MPRYGHYERRAQAQYRVVQELLHTHNLDLHTVDESDVVALIREVRPQEFMRNGNPEVLITTALPDMCRRLLQRLRNEAEQQPTSLANKAQLISYIEGMEALIEEVKKRLEQLKSLLL